MAKLTGHQFTASALSRGANGKVPSRRLVLAYTTACEADTREAIRLWKAARRAEEERRRRAGISPEFRDLAVSLRSVMTHPDPHRQLRQAARRHGGDAGQRGPALPERPADCGRTNPRRPTAPAAQEQPQRHPQR
ncbi:hypothetical protein ABT218_35265 [Streptomyces sp. NPDC001455]|uniref:hypothetical protein n=1 Tax=Streptomyces sp. NPDC001455 TaxID=3154518 RepID=UPI00332AF3AB